MHAKTETLPPRRHQLLWTFAAVIAVALLILSGCSKQAPPPPEKQYSLTGKVVSVNAKEQTASIDHEPIKGWMDEAMTMDYPIRSKAEFDRLHPGERITATVNVRGLDYDLTDIRKLQPGP